MNDGRRIFFNALATYGRSLVALVCGLCTSRWALNALGVRDFGLWGMIGGLIGFVSFFNNILYGAVSRFYAFSIGASRGRNADESGLRDCQGWFSSAVGLFLVLSVAAGLAGTFAGDWFICHSLSIPADRLDVCRKIWVISCVSCAGTMLAAPCQAMFCAKQEIAEMTVYPIVAQVMFLCFGYYMSCHERDWLLPYAVASGVYALALMLVLSIRAFVAYPECRLRVRALFNLARARRILAFAGGCSLIGTVQMLNTTCGAILVNRLLGPVLNATVAIGNKVNDNTVSCSNAITAAFMPALTQAAGSGNLEKMRGYAYQMCCIATCVAMIFVLPLLAEMEFVLRFWLKNPPPDAAPMCACLLVATTCDLLLSGFTVSVSALGRVAKCYACEACARALMIPLAWYLIARGQCGVVGIGYALAATAFLALLVKLYFGHVLAGLSVGVWLRRVLCPIILSTAVAAGVLLLVRIGMDPSLLRLAVSVVTGDLMLVAMFWFVVLDGAMRSRVFAKVGGIFHVC